MRFIKFLLVMLLLMTNCSSFADHDPLRVTLGRIDQVLAQADPLIHLGQSQQGNTSRIRFQFKRLRQDILVIRQGLRHAMQPMTIQPRTVMALKGDYISGDAS